MKNIYNTFGIYRITNTKNGKSYIGKTANTFGDRWDHHKALLRHNKHSNPCLQDSWNRYGESVFEFKIIETATDPSALDALEIKYIKTYKQNGVSYNMHDGGSSVYNLGKTLSEETKRKIGEKNRINMTGRKLSAETRRRMSEAQKRRKWTEEERAVRSAKSREINLGRVRSEETKEKLRRINQDNPPSARLTPDDVRNIRRMKSDGYKLTELAEMYNTSPGYISSIINFRRWAHIQ